MSQALVTGLIGIVGSAAVIRRIKEIRMYYASEGQHNVLIAVCVSDGCLIDHVDIDGSMHNNVNLNANDLVLGGKVIIKSGRMLIMNAEVAGMI